MKRKIVLALLMSVTCLSLVGCGLDKKQVLEKQKVEVESVSETSNLNEPEISKDELKEELKQELKEELKEEMKKEEESTKEETDISNEETIEEDSNIEDTLAETEDCIVNISGTNVGFSLPSSWNIYKGETMISCHPEDNIEVAYKDSLMKPTDDAMKNEMQILRQTYENAEATTLTLQYSVGEVPGYLVVMSKDGIAKLRIYQPVFDLEDNLLDTCIVVEITNYSKEYDITNTNDQEEIMNLIKSYGLTF